MNGIAGIYSIYDARGTYDENMSLMHFLTMSFTDFHFLNNLEKFLHHRKQHILINKSGLAVDYGHTKTSPERIISQPSIFAVQNDSQKKRIRSNV